MCELLIRMMSPLCVITHPREVATVWLLIRMMSPLCVIIKGNMNNPGLKNAFQRVPIA